jgi:isopentenyl-diphosphate Delta-isomerase
MLNANELLFTVDANNQPIEPLIRKEAHAKGVWHRCTHIWIYNSKGQVLSHKRSLLKDSMGGYWEAFFGGHILAGVDPITGALAELKEETNIEAREQDLEFIEVLQFVNGMNKEFVYLYLYKWDGDISKLSFEPDEVEEAVWVELKALRSELQNNTNNKWTQPAHIYKIIDLLESRGKA